MDIHSKEIIDERLEIVQIKNNLYGFVANIETYNVINLILSMLNHEET